MVILPTQPHIEVKVVVDGEDAVEYQVDKPTEPVSVYGPNQIMRYIESKSDKEFYIQFDIGGEFNFEGNSLACFMKVDGRNDAIQPIMNPNFMSREFRGWTKIFANGTEGVCKFKFASVSIGMFPFHLVRFAV